MSSGPAQPNAMAYFDAQNLYMHAKAAFGHTHPNFDPTKLHQHVCDRLGLRKTLTHLYSGIPDRKHSPFWAEYWTKRKLALKRSGVHVVTRPLRYHQYAGTLVPREKGIDVRLALDVVSLARKQQYDVAILFSQDQDLVEVVDEVRDISKEQGRLIRLVSVFPTGPNATSRRGIDRTEWVTVDQADYDACLDERDYRS